jgi:hypothetical protein
VDESVNTPAKVDPKAKAKRSRAPKPKTTEDEVREAWKVQECMVCMYIMTIYVSNFLRFSHMYTNHVHKSQTLSLRRKSLPSWAFPSWPVSMGTRSPIPFRPLTLRQCPLLVCCRGPKFSHDIIFLPVRQRNSEVRMHVKKRKHDLSSVSLPGGGTRTST